MKQTQLEKTESLGKLFHFTGNSKERNPFLKLIPLLLLDSAINFHLANEIELSSEKKRNRSQNNQIYEKN